VKLSVLGKGLAVFHFQTTTMETPLIYWTDSPPDRGPARIRSKRAMICRPLGCSPRHVFKDEEITVSDSTLRELTGDDVEFLGRAADGLAFEI
jgi:hypothetical protein